MSVLLGIDLGTSALKAAVFDLDGRLLGRGVAANEYLPGPPGHAEQDPRAWWAACQVAVRAALADAGLGPAAIAGIGVCGFHHCPVFLGADGEPVRPTIVTHDDRLGASLARLEASGTLKRLVDLSGSRVLTGHLPPIYHEVRTNDPAALDRTRWLLLAKDYLRFKLTGEIATDLCDATGTNLVAMPGESWSAELCDLLRVPPAILPPIGPSAAVCGAVTLLAAEATGLAAGTPVVHGGGDSHCALLGLGVAAQGQAGLLLGTNSTLRAAFDGPVRCLDRSVWMQHHVVPGRYTVSASSMAGASALDWLKDLVHEDLPGDPALAYRRLDSMAQDVPPGSDGLLFHPYLAGERSPFFNPDARGAFLGLAHWHGRPHLVRAVMEGVAFSIANCLDVLRDIARQRGEAIGSLRLAGSGGARLLTWRGILADVLADAPEVPLDLVATEEPGCLGAALLAGVGVGLYSDLPSAVARTVRLAAHLQPDPARAAIYAARRQAFNETYRLIEPVLYHQSETSNPRHRKFRSLLSGAGTSDVWVK